MDSALLFSTAVRSLFRFTFSALLAFIGAILLVLVASGTRLVWPR